MIALAQRANLETREAKHEPRSLAQQRATTTTASTSATSSAMDVAGFTHQLLKLSYEMDTLVNPPSEADDRDCAGIRTSTCQLSGCADSLYP